MNAAEKAALDWIRESLEEWSGQRYAQHILSEDLRILIRLVEKNEQKKSL